jgi:hypothetical protein
LITAYMMLVPNSGPAPQLEIIGGCQKRKNNGPPTRNAGATRTGAGNIRSEVSLSMRFPAHRRLLGRWAVYTKALILLQIILLRVRGISGLPQ